MRSLKEKQGFTLVELLVVVTIIAILSTIGIVIFTDAQKNARDARRKADIDAIAKAIETSRGLVAVYYTSLPKTSFSGGVVPTDTSTTAKYCLLTVIAADTKVNDPTGWTGTCPTTSGASPEVTTNPADKPVVAIEIPAAGLSAGGAPFGTTTGGIVTSNNVRAWKVCAKLESSSAFFCKGSAQ